jgi:NhaP-type Na+/H+ or K+/H+ antiporter
MALLIAIVLGLLLSHLFPNNNITSIPHYETFLNVILAIGLYGSVHGINLKEFRMHQGIIFRAITFGVLVKNLIIGGIMWAIFHTPLAFLLAIIVTQIDPLSVAHLIEKKSNKFSTSARTILRAWSSFDDPMTIILALYIFLPFLQWKEFTLIDGVMQIGINLVLALCIYVIWTHVKRRNTSQLFLLFFAFLASIWMQLLLAIAIVGLYLRPRIPYLAQIVQGTFLLSAIILGSLITFDPQAIICGVTLGAIAFFAQGIATLIVAPKLKSNDKLFLSFAQYNGITSIILALVISQHIPQVLNIIGVAILTINGLYFAVNYILEWRLRYHILLLPWIYSIIKT